MSNIKRPRFPDFPRVDLVRGPLSTPKQPKLAGAPVVFSAQATLAPGTNTILNAQTLQSGFRTPYFIDEIHISMRTNATSSLGGPGAVMVTGLSDLVRIKFQTGKYMFSADEVPVGLMAPIFGTDYGVVSAGTNLQRSYSTVRWALPKPLFMPAGDVVLANVLLMSNPALIPPSPPGTVTVTVTYVGRLIPQGYRAQSREVPWLAWWNKATVPGGPTYASAATRFRNPFLIPAHVQRFTQRTYQQLVIPPVPPVVAFSHYNEVSASHQLAVAGATFETIKIDDSRGYFIVNKYTPVGDVFDVTRHAWTFGRELTSREQFNVQLTTENIAALPPDVSYNTNIGLVGYRSEAP